MKFYIIILVSTLLCFSNTKIEAASSPLLIIGSINLGDYTVGPHIVTKKGVWSERAAMISQNTTDANLTEIFNTTAFGLTETTGIQMSLPIAAHNKPTGGSNNLGLEDLLLFGQWQFYKQEPNMAIINLGIRPPTRTVQSRFSQISRTTSYIFDIAVQHSSELWYAGARAFVVVTPEYHGLKPGSYFFYTLDTGPHFRFKKGMFTPSFTIRGIHKNNNVLNGFERFSGKSLLFFGAKLKYELDNISIGAGWRQPVMQNTSASGIKFEWVTTCFIQVDL